MEDHLLLNSNARTHIAHSNYLICCYIVDASAYRKKNDRQNKIGIERMNKNIIHIYCSTLSTGHSIYM